MIEGKYIVECSTLSKVIDVPLPPGAGRTIKVNKTNIEIRFSEGRDLVSVSIEANSDGLAQKLSDAIHTVLEGK